MTSPGANPTFDNISQRVVFSHQRQMPAFVPVLPETLSASEQDEMRVSQQELDAFFRALYRSIHDHPETFGLPISGDVCVDQGASKEQKQDVSRKVRKEMLLG